MATHPTELQPNKQPKTLPNSEKLNLITYNIQSKSHTTPYLCLHIPYRMLALLVLRLLVLLLCSTVTGTVALLLLTTVAASSTMDRSCSDDMTYHVTKHHIM